jgi:hypothetical protein
LEVVPLKAVAPLQGAMVAVLVVASHLDAMWGGAGGGCCDGGDCLRHPFMTQPNWIDVVVSLNLTPKTKIERKLTPKF